MAFQVMSNEKKKSNLKSSYMESNAHYKLPLDPNGNSKLHPYTKANVLAMVDGWPSKACAHIKHQILHKLLLENISQVDPMWEEGRVS